MNKAYKIITKVLKEANSKRQKNILYPFGRIRCY